MNEMKAHLNKGKRKKDEPLDGEVREVRGDDVELPSSSKIQKTLNSTASQSKITKSIESMVRKSLEEVVEERHSKGLYQTTLEFFSKSKEDKRKVKQHIATFFYENGIPFNAAHSRSYEIMVKSIGQFGSGLKSRTYHELRVPLLETSKSETEKIRERHEKSWKQYGCSLMCDGWTDKQTRHLINFLVNSQERTFFVCSTDVSSKVQDVRMLATWIEEQINLIGKEYVVQVVTDNGANFKAARGKLCESIPTLYWTTRFATTFLTLQSLYTNRDALRKLFDGPDWFNSKLSKTTAGGKVHDAVPSVSFWNNVEDCIRALQPLLVALRIVDADETPALAEICAAMDNVKVKISDNLEKRPRVLAKVLAIIDRRWKSQMEVDLYGAALFRNPGKFFDIKDKDFAYSSRLRMKFNEVLEKMVPDTILMEIISNQADYYENSRMSFGK